MTKEHSARSPSQPWSAGCAGGPFGRVGRVHLLPATKSSPQSVPNDYRQRHPIAVQEADHSIVIFVGKARGGLSAAQRADVMGLARSLGARRHRLRSLSTCRSTPPNAGPRRRLPGNSVAARGRRCAVARHQSASAISPKTPAAGDDPAELSEDAAVAGPCGLWPEDIGPSILEPRLQREQAVLQFRLREPAQSRGDDRQSRRISSSRDPKRRLYRAAQRAPSKNIARARRPRPSIPKPTRPNSAIQANDQHASTTEDSRTSRRRTPTNILRRHRAYRCRHFARPSRRGRGATGGRRPPSRQGASHRFKMGGLAAAIEAYHTVPTPNVIILEIRRHAAISLRVSTISQPCAIPAPAWS